jgi:hypothetical protein
MIGIVAAVYSEGVANQARKKRALGLAKNRDLYKYIEGKNVAEAKTKRTIIKESNAPSSLAFIRRE